jgi:hypothetical protein
MHLSATTDINQRLARLMQNALPVSFLKLFLMEKTGEKKYVV